MHCDIISCHRKEILYNIPTKVSTAFASSYKQVAFHSKFKLGVFRQSCIPRHGNICKTAFNEDLKNIWFDCPFLHHEHHALIPMALVFKGEEARASEDAKLLTLGNDEQIYKTETY